MPLAHPTRRRAPAVLLALALLLCAAAGTAAGAPTLAGTRAEIAELGGRVAELDVRVGWAAHAHNAALDRFEAARARLAGTRRGLAQARLDLERAQGRLADRLVAIYVSGPPSLAEVLLSSRSVAEAQAAREALDAVARGDAGAVTAVRRGRALLGELEEGQAAAESARRREVAEAAAQRERLDALLEERRRLLARARADLRRQVRAEGERRRREAALARARREALAAAHADAARTAAAPGALPAGAYVFPVAGPTRFSDDWMAARAGGRVHQGIDLFAPHGTPLVAVADGTLFRVGSNSLGGWRLWLRDDAGTTFYYAHLSAYAPGVVEGARVARGTVIGFVGDTGDARGTPPHLHFEIHPGGAGPVPPYPIVSAWPRPG